MDIMALRRSAISNLADLNVIGWDLVKLILMNVTENSPLRRCALDMYIAHWTPIHSRTVPQLDNETSPEYLLAYSKFLGEVLTGVALRTSSPEDSTKCPCCNDLCRYHEHQSEEEREASM